MRDEAITGLAALVGWALITLALTHFLTLWVWPVSAGLLLLSGVGWRMLAVLAYEEGLYSLTRDDEEGT